MSHLNFLEQFENDRGVVATHARVENLPGYDAGHAAGIAQAAADQAALQASIIDQLQEAQFTIAEAQQSLLANLGPFVHAICDNILPDIVDDLTRAKLVEMFLLAAENDIAQPMTLTVNPLQEAAMAEFLHQSPHLSVQLITDPLLAAHEVLIGTQTQETQLNVPDVIAKMRDALSSIIRADPKEIVNG